jgi:mono/diheme cytochrome c family protein
VKKLIRFLLVVVGLLIVLFVVIQFLPIGKNHTNPAVVSEPNWDSTATRALAQRACFDCHSNETIWPWYSNIAPVSWLLYNDAMKGRTMMNFSDWNRGYQPSIDEIIAVIQGGQMPPMKYLLMHPDARLSATEKLALIDGLRNSIPVPEAYNPVVTSTGNSTTLDGFALMQERCSSCHGLDKITSAHETTAEWQSIVEKMIKFGAQLNTQEEQILIDYLAQNYR